MSYFQVIIITVLLTFAGWLIFSKTKKVKRPSYTSGKKKYKLYNDEKMLDNITKKPIDNIEIKEEIFNEKELDADAKKGGTVVNQTSNRKKNRNSKSDGIDLKSAIIGSNIIEKKRK